MWFLLGFAPTRGGGAALLVKPRRTAVSLKKDGFAWTMLGPEVPEVQTGLSNALSGSGITLTLYELWVGGQVAYEIEGGSGQPMNTTLNGQEAVVDLEAEYGICEVPGGYFFGA